MRAFLLLLALLTSPVSFGQTQKQDLSWKATSAWITELPKDQQTAVVGLSLLALARKGDELFRNEQTPAQFTWVMRIWSCGDIMLSEVATENLELKNRLRAREALFLKAITGELSTKSSQFENERKRLQVQISALLDSAPKGMAYDMMTSHKEPLHKSTRALLVTAMACASSGK